MIVFIVVVVVVVSYTLLGRMDGEGVSPGGVLGLGRSDTVARRGGVESDELRLPTHSYLQWKAFQMFERPTRQV